MVVVVEVVVGEAWFRTPRWGGGGGGGQVCPHLTAMNVKSVCNA